MQKNQTPHPIITFENMPQAIAKVHEEISLVRDQLIEIKEKFEPKIPNEYVSRTALSEKLSCDISTIHNWTVKGKLRAYGIGNRVYYKLHEVEAALIPFGKEKADNSPKGHLGSELVSKATATIIVNNKK